ncbi:pentatricopeptide repeat-containing protein [Cinnamomum micranthum f. kanehirae]|uniref:Pentatricopeptide repeat-containing protein n=1 Tax=Cinnamomum micranthum f. kanehirae TaxID=337451 RepID=A0A443PI13_9MAGN|nr:pentatricopeptide repeat-containing protein [Cinnamomum micranthum f. kanehirae]
MALSKPFFFHLKTHLKPYHHAPRPPFLSLRLLSFATPEEAAAERRRRKRRMRIEPPLNSLRPSSPRPQQPISPPQNPNAPKLPDTVAALAGNRLTLHNNILTLIRENDLDEASLLVRHSIYSNCRPTVFTCNAVLAALLRQSRYSDLLSLHRFITQASVSPNVITYNLLIQAYCDCRKTDLALDHYKQLLNSAPFNPSPTTYRSLARGLVDNGRLDRALSLNEDMIARGLAPDPIVYFHLMSGAVKSDQPDKALELYSDLKEKSGGSVLDGVVYGPLINGFFKKGMEKEALDCYNELISGIGSSGSDISGGIRIGAVGYNSVLDALSKNGKFDIAMELFDRMMQEHNPPRRLSVNLGSFNVMVDMLCGDKRFDEAVEVFRKMSEKKCFPDTLSCNNLIDQLCKNGMVAAAEEIYHEMGEKAVSADEFTYVLLLDACFEENRVDDAAAYFTKMVEAGLRPNVVVYNKVIGGLVKAGKLDEAKGFFRPDGREGAEARCLFTSEMREYVADALRKEGREEELTRLFEEKEREKEEKAAALAKEAEAAALAKEAEAAALAKQAEAIGATDVAVEAVMVNGDVASTAKEEDGENPSVEAEAVATSADVVDGSSNTDGLVGRRSKTWRRGSS